MDDVKISLGDSVDFHQAADLMQEHVKWFVAYGDFDAYVNACGDGYKFVVAKTQKGEFVGCVAFCRFGGDLAFIDLFFVHPQFRGSGRGRIIFETALPKSIRDECNVGLHSEIDLSTYYKSRQGFTHFNEVTLEVLHLTNFVYRDSSSRLFAGIRIVEGVRDKEDDILKIDEKVWQSSRKEFLSAWTNRLDARTLVAYSDGSPIGYGVIRPAARYTDGHILGPVYADSPDAFLALLYAMLEPLPLTAVVEIRSPSVNTERLQRLLSVRGPLRVHGRYITQFTKRVPSFNYEPVYAVTDTNVPV